MTQPRRYPRKQYCHGGTCDSCAHWRRATEKEPSVWGDFGGHCGVLKLQTYESYTCEEWAEREKATA